MLRPKRSGSGAGGIFSGLSDGCNGEPARAGSLEQISRSLRQEREHRQISLQEVEQRTRIPLKYLQLLEGQGNARAVPDPLYLISPLRDYAAFLNVNLGTALSDFITEVGELPSAEEKARASERPTLWLASVPQLRSRFLLRTLSLLFLLGILAFAGHYSRPTLGSRPKAVKTASLPPPSAPPPLPESEPPLPANSPAFPGSPQMDQSEPLSPPPAVSPPVTVAPQAQPSVSPAPPVAPAVLHPLPPPQKPLGRTPHRLRIQATAKTWLHVTINNQPMKRLFLLPGQALEWSAEQGFVLSLGNARAVKLIFDGLELPPLGKAGQTVLSVRLPSHQGGRGGQVRYAEHVHAAKSRSPRHSRARSSKGQERKSRTRGISRPFRS
jgi:cytoskeleton protein RodZ